MKLKSRPSIIFTLLLWVLAVAGSLASISHLKKAVRPTINHLIVYALLGNNIRSHDVPILMTYFYTKSSPKVWMYNKMHSFVGHCDASACLYITPRNAINAS